MALIRAELLKLATTRLWWVMLLVMLGYVALSLGAFIAVAGAAGPSGQPGLPDRGSVAFQELMWSSGTGGTLFAAVLGAVMMTSEYRYLTITTTFLVTPRRVRVVAAKLAAGVVVGILLGLGVLLLTAATTAVTVLIAGGDVAFTGTIARIALGVLAVLALYTLFGFGIGALIKNQVGAIVAVIVWVLLVESLVNAIPPLQPVGKWTPAGAAGAITTSGADLGLNMSYLLPAWVGALVLLGYALLFALLASVTTLRRDIT